MWIKNESFCRFFEGFLVINFRTLFFGHFKKTSAVYTSSGSAKWISKWRGHWTLKSIVMMVGRQEQFLNSRHSRIAKTATFWPWWKPFNSFFFETLSFFPLFPFFLSCYAKKQRGYTPWCRQPFLFNIFSILKPDLLMLQ